MENNVKKRKHHMMDQSDDEHDSVRQQPKLKSEGSNSKRGRLIQILYINLIIVTIFLIPFFAIKFSHQEGFLNDVVDSIIGERCSSPTWVPKNLSLLRSSFHENVFGQHIAENIILSALSRRWSSNNYFQKPLVLSFHGWTGSGKNYLAKYIAESLFKNGLKSRFVKTYISTVHFYDERNVQTYQQNLREWVLGNVSRCPETMFIFDEVDKMPIGVLDALRPFMDHHSIIDGVDMSRALFVLLSNTGGKDITTKTFEAWKLGQKREELRYADFENLILKGAFNEVGGLKKSAIIDRSVIDLYVPFLPLEQQHIRMCARKELKNRAYEGDDVQEIIQQVLADLSFWPEESKIYSATGCKRVALKVDEILYEKHSL